MTKTLLIAGAAILVVYILVSGSGGKLFKLAPPNRLAPKPTKPPPTSGPGTRYQDANVWIAVTAAAPSLVDAIGKAFSGGSSVPSSAGGGGSWDSSSQNNLPLLAGDTAFMDDTTHDDLLS
jgi:hypothetical protein